jgi:phage-related protein
LSCLLSAYQTIYQTCSSTYQTLVSTCVYVYTSVGSAFQSAAAYLLGLYDDLCSQIDQLVSVAYSFPLSIPDVIMEGVESQIKNFEEEYQQIIASLFSEITSMKKSVSNEIASVKKTLSDLPNSICKIVPFTDSSLHNKKFSFPLKM